MLAVPWGLGGGGVFGAMSPRALQRWAVLARRVGLWEGPAGPATPPRGLERPECVVKVSVCDFLARR